MPIAPLLLDFRARASRTNTTCGNFLLDPARHKMWVNGLQSRVVSQYEISGRPHPASGLRRLATSSTTRPSGSASRRTLEGSGTAAAGITSVKLSSATAPGGSHVHV